MPFDSVLVISFISIPKSQATARPGGAAVEVAWDGIGNKSILSFLEGKKKKNKTKKQAFLDKVGV